MLREVEVKEGTREVLERSTPDAQGRVTRPVSSRRVDSVRPLTATDPEFTAFVRLVMPTLERLVVRLAPAGADAYDIAAEALTRVYVRWASLGEVTNKRAWALKVATNLAYNAWAKEARWKRHVRSRGPAPAVTRFEDDIANRDLLRPALLALPKRQRTAIALRYLADLPLSEVAGAMGIGPETAKTHLERGLHSLRTALGSGLETEIGEPHE